jgi:r-opsin
VWIMPPLFGWNRFILEGFGTSCTFDYVSTNFADRLFILLLVTGGFFIPLSVIVLAYCSILSKLSERTRDLVSKGDDDRQLKHRSVTTYSFSQLNAATDVRNSRGASATPDSHDENNVTRNMRQTEARATRTALLISALFCLAWGPYALMALLSLSGFNHLVNAYTTAILGILTKFSACMNPMIYAISSNGFRKQIHLYIEWILPCYGKHAHHFEASTLDLTRRNLTQSTDNSTRQHAYSTPINRDSL